MTIETVSSGLDTIWVVLTAAMILLMEGGFALLEAGFVRSKNSVNIIMKVLPILRLGRSVIFCGLWIDVWKGLLRFIWNERLFNEGGFIAFRPLLISVDSFWLFQGAFVIAVISIVSGLWQKGLTFEHICYILLR